MGKFILLQNFQRIFLAHKMATPVVFLWWSCAASRQFSKFGTMAVATCLSTWYRNTRRTEDRKTHIILNIGYVHTVDTGIKIFFTPKVAKKKPKKVLHHEKTEGSVLKEIVSSYENRTTLFSSSQNPIAETSSLKV